MTLARAWAWLAVTLKTIHHAIVIAKMRRMQREFILHGDLVEEWLEPDRPLDIVDVRKIPQRPMTFDDKWDF